MAKKIVVTIYILVSTFALLNAQEKVNCKFEKEEFTDKFETDNSKWPVTNNAENLFVIQGGKYIIHRKADRKPKMIYPDWGNKLTSFSVKCAVKLDPKENDEKSSAGLLFMVQKDNKAGFAVEINTKKQYRINQLIHNSFHSLSGEEKNAGWVKSSAINKNDFNLLEIRTDHKQYDLYINDDYITSFTEITYKYGKMGLIINASTRAEIDYFYVYAKGENQIKLQLDSINNLIKARDSIIAEVLGDDTLSIAKGEKKAVTETESPNEEKKEEEKKPEEEKEKDSITPEKKEETVSNDNIHNPPDADILAFTEAIVKLKTQINILKTENKKMKEKIGSSPDLESAVKVLEKQLGKMNTINDSLMDENKKLIEYRKMIEESESKDLIIVLSKTLQKEKLKNKELSGKVGKLQNDLSELNEKIHDLNNQIEITTFNNDTIRKQEIGGETQSDNTEEDLSRDEPLYEGDDEPAEFKVRKAVKKAD